MTKVLLDTSVLVAALVSRHPRHGEARPFLERAHSGELDVVVCAHGLAEAFATLTVLPVSPRITPAEAERMLKQSVLAVAGVVTLSKSDYAVATARMVELGLISGAIYDALHVRAAEKSGCEALATLNDRDFRRMPPKAPCQLIAL